MLSFCGICLAPPMELYSKLYNRKFALAKPSSVARVTQRVMNGWQGARNFRVDFLERLAVTSGKKLWAVGAAEAAGREQRRF